MSSVMASMLNEGNILKAPNIQIAAPLYILPNIFSGYNKRALL